MPQNQFIENKFDEMERKFGKNWFDSTDEYERV